jgi:hypothetical protein
MRRALFGERRALARCSAGLHIFVDDNEALLRRAVDDRRRGVILFTWQTRTKHNAKQR